MYILGIVSDYRKKVSDLLEDKIKHFSHQYGNFLALLERIYPQKIYSIIETRLDDLLSHGRYSAMYRHFIRQGVNPDKPILALDFDFLTDKEDCMPVTFACS